MYAIINSQTGEAFTCTDLKGVSQLTDYKYETVKSWFRYNIMYKKKDHWHIAKVYQHIKSNRHSNNPNLSK